MTKPQTKKLTALLSKYTQKESVYAFLAAGNELAATDAKSVAVKDPKRVVNKLRTEHGIKINSSRRTLRDGTTTTVYSLGENY